MPHNVRVLIRLPETGMQTPVENGSGHVFGWTQQVDGLGYCYEFSSVDEFNRRAKELFETTRPPGHQYVPHVIVECGADEQPSDRLALLEETNAELKANTDALLQQLIVAQTAREDAVTMMQREINELKGRLVATEAPAQPPCDNDHVAEGCEQFASPDPESTQPIEGTSETPAYDYAGKIREKLALKNYRTNDLAADLEILPSDLHAFIDSPNSGFYKTQQGWVKEGAPAAE